MLDPSILQQVTDVFRNLEAHYTLSINQSPSREESKQLVEFLQDFASASSHLKVEVHETEGNTLYFSILKDGEETRSEEHTSELQSP